MTLKVNVSGRLPHEKGAWRTTKAKPGPWRCKCPDENGESASKLNPGYLVACPTCKTVRR